MDIETSIRRMNNSLNRNCGKGEVVFDMNKGQFLKFSVRVQEKSRDWHLAT
jgi:hypothetical protein